MFRRKPSKTPDEEALRDVRTWLEELRWRIVSLRYHDTSSRPNDAGISLPNEIIDASDRCAVTWLMEKISKEILDFSDAQKREHECLENMRQVEREKKEQNK